MNGPTDEIDWTVNKRIVYDIQKSYDFFNPKFGLNYDITQNHKVYASYAIAHKEPTRNNFENNNNAGLEMPKAERLNDLRQATSSSQDISLREPTSTGWTTRTSLC